MSAPLALTEPSVEAKATIRDLLFDDIADYASTIGAIAVQIGAAAERGDTIRIQARFALLRLAAIALLSDLDRLDGEPR